MPDGSIWKTYTHHISAILTFIKTESISSSYYINQLAIAKYEILSSLDHIACIVKFNLSLHVLKHKTKKSKSFYIPRSTMCWNYGSLLEWWQYYWNGGYTIEKVAHYWNGGYTIENVAHYWSGGYTIEIVAIIFLYKLISSSFVIISSHTSYTSLNGREKGSRVKEESRSEREN